MDNLTIAASLIRIREKHGYNSSLYRDAVEHVKENFAGWDSGDYRKRVSLAAQGFNHLAGSHKEKEWIVKKLNPSFSALAACVNIPDRLVHTFTTKELKKLEKFPTADAVINYGQSGNLLKGSKTTVSSQQPSYSAENLLHQPLHLLNLLRPIHSLYLLQKPLTSLLRHMLMRQLLARSLLMNHGRRCQKLKLSHMQ